MKKNILVGVTSGIAIYKSIDLVSMLVKNGHEVKVVMTENATKLINPLIFETISKNKVYCDVFERDMDIEVKHISLASWADLFIIAPATANTIAKIANGISDNLLTNIVLAHTKKMIIVPAMNVNMLNNAMTQENIDKLSKYHHIMESDYGLLACGDLGKGRFPKVERIYEEIESYFVDKDLLGKNILIANGPTIEEIDPVRYISNYSSGKMGNELALMAKRRGANVTVVCGNIKTDYSNFGIDYIRISNNEQMLLELSKRFNYCDILIMPAAPCDFRVVNKKNFKIKKDSDYNIIEIENNIDILRELGKNKKNQIIVGFAAETNNVIDYALRKIKEKNLDMIVANDVSNGKGFNLDFNTVSVISSRENVKEFSATKREIANNILDCVVNINVS